MTVLDSAASAPAPANPRTHALLHGPIAPTLLRLAWPNMLVMGAQASTGLIETWWVSHLGTEALAGMALVFPVVMLTQMVSGGAMGGGISSAVARALGGGQKGRADALVLHALLINGGIGILCSVLVLLFGPGLYRVLGGEGASLAAALAYSNVVFTGTVLLWVMNALASVLRGTGNMLVPALVSCGGAVLLVGLSPLLIFGVGPFPALGVAGGGVALVLYYAGGVAVLAWYVLTGRSLVRLRPGRPQPALFRDILRVGGLAAINSLQTNILVAASTALVGAYASGDGHGAVAGFGTGARLEYMLLPLVFGLGAPLVALVGTNIGAGHRARGLRVAWIGGAAAFAMTESIGLAAAIWPRAWLGLFGSDPAMLETGAAYLRAVGPLYGFYGLGVALYFASQGAGRLLWPVLGNLLRLLIGVGGGWAALQLTGSLGWLFVAQAAGMLVYGAVLAGSVALGAWFTRPGFR